MMNSNTSIIPLLPSGRAEIMALAGVAVVQDPEVIWLRPTQKLKNAVHIDTVRRL